MPFSELASPVNYEQQVSGDWLTLMKYYNQYKVSGFKIVLVGQPRSGQPSVMSSFYCSNASNEHPDFDDYESFQRWPGISNKALAGVPTLTSQTNFSNMAGASTRGTQELGTMGTSRNPSTGGTFADMFDNRAVNVGAVVPFFKHKFYRTGKGWASWNSWKDAARESKYYLWDPPVDDNGDVDDNFVEKNRWYVNWCMRPLMPRLDHYMPFDFSGWFKITYYVKARDPILILYKSVPQDGDNHYIEPTADLSNTDGSPHNVQKEEIEDTHDTNQDAAYSTFLTNNPQEVTWSKVNKMDWRGDPYRNLNAQMTDFSAADKNPWMLKSAGGFSDAAGADNAYFTGTVELEGGVDLPASTAQFDESVAGSVAESHPILVDIRNDGTTLTHLPSGISAQDLSDYFKDWL